MVCRPRFSSSRAPRTFFSLVALSLFTLRTLQVSAQVFSCTGGSVYLVAHPDDDLLFQSPDLLTDYEASNCITTVFLTSGDAGAGITYASSREAGNEAAAAEMMGVADNWVDFNATFGGQPVLIRTLTAAPQIQKVWVRLPDGDVDGSGYAVTGYESLRELYFGDIGTITTITGSATFTLATLQQMISQILAAREPSFVRTLDYLSQFDGGDHSDHLTVGRITAGLVGTYASNATFAGYMGYPIQNLAPTLSTTSTAFIEKEYAFFNYTPFDSSECQSYSACVAAGRGEASWLQRQYIVTPQLATVAETGSAQAPPNLPAGNNIASLATATASSYSPGQPPFAAIDGNIGGYPGNSSAEWASDGQGVGAWFQLTWSQTVNVTAIVLYDRPNLNDWMQGGTLTFSDGVTLTFGELFNDGSGTVLNLTTTYLTDTILLTVTAVGPATSNIGLSEFQVYGTLVSGVSSSSSSGASSTSTATTSSASATSTGTPSGVDLALSATASASSQNTATGQTANKAIDGVISGYPANYSAEWATLAQGVGATLTLTWTSPITANQLVLYDRPNLNDQITAGTIQFSDGSTVAVPTLNNDGSATTINLSSAKTFDSLTLTVTAVSSTTENVGLSEIQIYYIAGGLVLRLKHTFFVSRIRDVNNLIQLSVRYVDGDVERRRPGAERDGERLEPKHGNGAEWATLAQGVGATLTLTWTSPITANQLVLYDRPNLNDQITAGTIQFSDGSTVAVPTLNNDGSATTINLSSAKTFNSLTLTVTAVSSTTENIGLSEIQIYYISGGATSSSSFSSTATSTSSSASPMPTGTFDLALSATATASSQNTATGQTANKAIDGVISGYPANDSAEWATLAQGAGAWLSLTWPSTITLNEIILYDRPNLNDQVLNATVMFSDSTFFYTGTLVNAGTATTFSFATKSTTSLNFTVTSVSSTTENIGLSEFAVYYLPGGVTPNVFPQ
ncbi:hypothetical protein JCM1840_000427 [Sporobolomyces johnsonii]